MNSIDMDGSFLDPALGELERAVLAEERAEKAEANRAFTAQLLETAHQAIEELKAERDKAEAHVAELEKVLAAAAVQMCADAVHIQKLKKLCWCAGEVFVGEMAQQLRAAGRGEEIKP